MGSSPSCEVKNETPYAFSYSVSYTNHNVQFSDKVFNVIPPWGSKDISLSHWYYTLHVKYGLHSEHKTHNQSDLHWYYPGGEKLIFTIREAGASRSLFQLSCSNDGGCRTCTNYGKQDEEKREMEKRRVEEEAQRRQEQIERERRIQEEIEKECEALEKKQSQINEMLEMRRNKAIQRDKQVQVLHHLVKDDAPPIEDTENKDVEDKLKNLLMKYGILEDEPMQSRNLTERMTTLQYKMIAAYALKNELPIEALQSLDHVFYYEDLSLTEQVRTLTALMEVTLAHSAAEDHPLLSCLEYKDKNMYFLACVLNKLYQESKTMAGNILMTVIQEFSDVCKEQLGLILFNGIWDLAQTLTFYLEALNIGTSQEQITNILHQVQTYQLAFDISVAALYQNGPINYLVTETEKENDKDVKTIIEEMRQFGHSDAVLKFLQNVLGKLTNVLLQNTMKDLDADLKNEAIRLIRNFDPSNPNVNNVVKILIILSVAVEEITRVASEDLSKPVNGYFPRVTQFASLLILLLSDSPDGKGCLLEIGTGEGKSCIVALFALIQAIRGRTVDVVTSSPVLARRDAEEWSKLYEKFDVSCSVIPPPSLHTSSDSRDIDAAICKAYRSHIIYGTVEDFAADILRQEFEKKNTRNERKFDIAIVDEVDYMTLDNGIQITFLSHDATGMRHFDQLLTAIWTKVHKYQRIMEESGDIFWATGIQYFHKLATDTIVGQHTTDRFNSIHILKSGLELGLISEEDLQEVQTQTSSEGSDVKFERLIKKFGPKQQRDLLEIFGKVLNDSVQFCFFELKNDKASFTGNSCDTGEPLRILLLPEGLACLLMTEKELVNITVEELSDKIKYSDEYSSVDVTIKIDESVIILPKHLKKYTQDRLPVFVENALLAILMEKGREYAIDSRDRSDSPESHSIIPIDYKSTGVLEKNKCWGDGLQQFLELKHKLALSQISSVTNFMSNFHFFQQYIAGSGVYGVSGTLGDEVDFTFLKKHYKTSCYPMPTHRYTKKLELPVLHISGGREAWILEICTLVKKRTSPKCGTEGQCVLVVCEDVKTAEELQLKLIELNAISDPAKITLYTRSDKHNVETKIFQPGEVILATNLGGRGTDIKVTQEVNKSGGLSVILTHFPANRRVEKQIFGRTSRKGNPGVVQMVLNQQDLPPAYQGQTVEEMRKLRENYETKRIADMENDELVEVSTRQELFNMFCDHLKMFSSHYSNDERQDFHSRCHTLPRDYLKKSGSHKLDYHPALNSMKETWALWLTTHEKDINDHKDIGPLRDDLSHVLTVKSFDLLQGKSENFYDYIKVAMDRTHLHIGNKSNDYGALFYWEKMGETDNMYRAISLYNRALITINMGKDGYKEKAITLLQEAKTALAIYTSEICNVITFGNVTQSSKFEPHNQETNFSLQTQMKMQLISSWETYIENTIEKLGLLEEKKKGAITKEASVFTLSETLNRSKVEADEVSLLYDYGLSLVFEVEQKPEFCFDALICFIFGGLQILAGILICGLTCGTMSPLGFGLISEGVSDMLIGIEGMIKGTFDWAQWAIAKACSIALSLAIPGFKILFKSGKAIASATKGLLNGTQTFSALSQSIVKSGKTVLSSAASNGTSSAMRNYIAKSIVPTNAKKVMVEAAKFAGKQLVKQNIEKALKYAINTATKKALKKIFMDQFLKDLRRTLRDDEKLDNALTSYIVAQTVPMSVLQKQHPDSYIISPRSKKFITCSIENLVSSALEEVCGDHKTYSSWRSNLKNVCNVITTLAETNISVSGLKTFEMSVYIADYALQIADIVKYLPVKSIVAEKIIPPIISFLSEFSSPVNDARCKLNDVRSLNKDIQRIISDKVTAGMTDLMTEQVVDLLQTTWHMPYVKEKVTELSNTAGQWLEKIPKKVFGCNLTAYPRHDGTNPESVAQVKDITEEARSYLKELSKGSFQNIDLEFNALARSPLLEGRGVKVTLVKEDGAKAATQYYPGNNTSAEPIELQMKKRSGQFAFCAIDPEDNNGNVLWDGLYDVIAQVTGERITGAAIKTSIHNEIQQNMERYLAHIARGIQRQKWNDLASHYKIPGLDTQHESDPTRDAQQATQSTLTITAV
ncbi:uncharacterized protein PAF06_019439 [Gastrophryne carolinensis]